MSIKPATHEEYQEFVEEAVATSNDWKEAYNDKITVVERKKYKSSSLNSVRVSSLVEGVSPLKLLEIIYDPKYEELFTKVVEDDQVLEEIDENNLVHYCAMKSPFLLVSHRDFVTRRSIRKKEDECIVLFKSIEHEKMPTRSGHVRAFTYINGYYMKKHEKGTELTYVTRGDLGGYFPSWVINYVATQIAPGVIQNVKEVVQKVAEMESNQILK
eukprot:gene3066-5236_t